MAASDLESEEALLRLWGGPMFHRNKHGTKPSPKLDSLLRGIAKCISTRFEKGDHGDLSPAAMADFYRSCGGDYNQLFLIKPSQSIAFIYAKLGCPHSLQPPPTTSFSPPTIPALKPKGFVKWETIQLLLGPSEHVPVIQNALALLDVRDPDTGAAFPNQIPSIAFPTQPDPNMVAWHEEISSRLRNEATRPVRPQRPASPSSTEVSQDEEPSTEERTDAAHHFANPLYKNKEGRPAIVRQLTKVPGKMLQGGMSVAQNVIQGGKMVLSPNTFGGPARRKSDSRSTSRGREGHQPHSAHGRNMSGGDSNRVHASPRPHYRPSHQSPQYARPSRRYAASPVFSDEEAELEPLSETSQRRRRRTSYESGSRSTSKTSGTFDQGVRRHRSMDHRHNPPNVRPRTSNVPPDDREGGSKPLQQKRRSGEYDYFGPASHGQGVSQKAESYTLRPSLTYRTASGQEERRGSHGDVQPRPEALASNRGQERRGSYGNVDGRIGRMEDTYSSGAAGTGNVSADGRLKPHEARAPGAGRGGMSLTPNTQAEWDGLRQTVAGAAESNGAGVGVRFAATTDEEDSGLRRDKRQSGVKNVAPVNGVKGRVYPNEAPWEI